jgi:enolase-phosphatase E1
VLAQRLLFGSTSAGDLTKYLAGYFDTAVGPKNAPESYRAITEAVHIDARQVLFVSDVVAELDAAAAVGMATALCVRGDGDPVPRPCGHRVIRSFEEIVL